MPGGSIGPWGLSRRINSTAANLLTRLALRTTVRDCSAGFRCYRADVARAIDFASLRSRGYAVIEAEAVAGAARFAAGAGRHGRFE